MADIVSLLDEIQKNLPEIAGAFGMFAISIFFIFLLICTILIPISVYYARHHAKNCWKELKRLNENLELFLQRTRGL
ncbi:hypothetical protein UR09_03985 [Candidatus Nitromaritima sp. SCGC AAA799-A02]|nr:hypothetical protein UR09_03985 [Candidatus Nitromaritima sp. SCGC AAA799-A02]